jgi:hypothetical protein
MLVIGSVFQLPDFLLPAGDYSTVRGRKLQSENLPHVIEGDRKMPAHPFLVADPLTHRLKIVRAPPEAISL